MEAMTHVSYTHVHNKFKINGHHLDKDDLCRVAYSFIKEGLAFEKPVGDFLLDWFDDRDYMMMSTSGTTGAPKSIKVFKQAMVNSAIATGDFFELNPGDKVLNCLPVKFIAGKMMFIRSFILGLEMDFVAPSSKPMSRIDQKYHFGAMVPMQAQNSLDKLHLFDKLIIGGAKISKVLEDDLLKISTEIFETYGMTETITHIAAKRIGETHFKAFPNVQISQDERECLVINAPKIHPSEIVTNDLVKLNENSNFQWLGRIDNVINSGGIKFIPEIIEEKLNNQISRRFFIGSEFDSILGEKLVLFIEGEAMDISDVIFSGLSKFEIPKNIYFIKHFEETHNGKIMRFETLNKFYS